MTFKARYMLQVNLKNISVRFQTNKNGEITKLSIFYDQVSLYLMYFHDN